MKKQTASFVIGIGIASIISGAYSAFRSGELIDSLSGVFIGVSLIGAVLFERSQKGKGE